MKNMKPNLKLLKERFVTSLLIVSTRISEGDQYGSKDACTIYKCS